MMKKKSVISIVLLISMLMTLFLSGCGEKDDDKSAADENAGYSSQDTEIVSPEDGSENGLVFIIGNHANSKAVSSDLIEQYKGLIDNAYTYSTVQGGKIKPKLQIKLIVCDGEPEVVSLPNEILAEIDKPNFIFNKVRDAGPRKSKITDAIIDYLTSDAIRADDSEVDIYEALQEAKYALSDMTGDKHIVVFDTLLPTKGRINFLEEKQDIQKLTPEEIYNTVKDTLPDFTGIKLYIDNVANIAQPQSDEVRKAPVVDNLIKFWTLVFGESLQREIKIGTSDGINLTYTQESGKSLPRVSPIPIVIDNDDDCITSIPSDQIGFLKNSADFVDPDYATFYIKRMTEGLVDTYKSNSDMIFYIVGSVAQVDKDIVQSTSKYSLARAEKIKAEVVKATGIPEKNFVVIDAGMTAFSWRCADEFASNDPVKQEEERAKNRVVTIIPETESCKEFNELKKMGFVK